MDHSLSMAPAMLLSVCGCISPAHVEEDCLSIHTYPQNIRKTQLTQPAAKPVTQSATQLAAQPATTHHPTCCPTCH